MMRIISGLISPSPKWNLGQKIFMRITGGFIYGSSPSLAFSFSNKDGKLFQFLLEDKEIERPFHSEKMTENDVKALIKYLQESVECQENIQTQ